MPDLPIGTVTFVFTDIAGSTHLWEQHNGAMSMALARHDAILRVAVESHHGVVFKTVGDAGHAVFGNASDALAAALDQGDVATSYTLFEESLALFRETGDKRNIALPLKDFGLIASQQGDHTTART